MRWLVRFGYDGASFAGWARQPGLRTVEGEIIRGLEQRGLTSPGDPGGLSVASRTDRGVGARANALALRVDLGGPRMLRMLNSIDPAIFFTAATPVDDVFRPRRALGRVYRYYEAPDPTGATFPSAAWTAAARLFRGRIDVRSFGRRIPAGEPCWREVETVTVHPTSGGAWLEIRAPSFVWGMVRKIVAALREHASGRLSLADLQAAVQGREVLTLPQAEADALVLWSVDYGIPWTVRWSGPNRYQAQAIVSAQRDLWVRRRVLAALPPRVLDGRAQRTSQMQ